MPWSYPGRRPRGTESNATVWRGGESEFLQKATAVGAGRRTPTLPRGLAAARKLRARRAGHPQRGGRAKGAVARAQVCPSGAACLLLHAWVVESFTALYYVLQRLHGSSVVEKFYSVNCIVKE